MHVQIKNNILVYINKGPNEILLLIIKYDKYDSFDLVQGSNIPPKAAL